MMPCSFDTILFKIQNNTIFNQGGAKPQLPVIQQLGIFLFKLGRYGISVGDVAQWAGIGEGTVDKAFNR